MFQKFLYREVSADFIGIKYLLNKKINKKKENYSNEVIKPPCYRYDHSSIIGIFRIN